MANPNYKPSKDYRIILSIWLNAMLVGMVYQIYQNYKAKQRNKDGV